MRYFNFFIPLLIILIAIKKEKSVYSKYKIKEGIINCVYESSFTDGAIKQQIFFSKYGATEYFKFLEKQEFRTFDIIKIDSLEYLIVDDSTALDEPRGFDNIFEKLVIDKNSKLYSPDLKYQILGDTIILDKKCDLIKFQFEKLNQTGKAAIWEGIPLWINSNMNGEIFENIKVMEIDLNSNIPENKKSVLKYTTNN